MRNLIKRSYIVILPILAFVIYGFLWHDSDMNAPDTSGYTIVAEDISDGQIDNLHARTLGYPLLLLLTGSSQQPSTMLFYMQLLMYVLSVVALCSLMDELNVSKKLILLFSFVSLLPYKVDMTAVALTESLTAFTLVFGLYFLFKWFTKEKKIYLVLLSVLFAYAAITRPTYQLMVFVFLFVLLAGFSYFKAYRKKLITATIAVGISSFIIIGSLFYTNYTKFNYVGLTPLIGYNLCNKTVSVIEQLPEEHKKVKDILIKYRDIQLLSEYSSHKGYNYIWNEKAIPELMEATNLDIGGLSNYLKELHISLIKESPMRYSREVVSSMGIYWLLQINTQSIFDSKMLVSVYFLIHYFLIISFFLLLVIIFGMIFISSFKKIKCKIIDSNDELFLVTLSIPLVIIFYSMAISALVESGDPRFRIVTDLYIYFFIFSVYSFIREKLVKK